MAIDDVRSFLRFKCHCPFSLQKRVLAIAVTDLILAVLPLVLYTLWAFVMGGLWMAGFTEKPNRLLKVGLTDIMAVEPGTNAPLHPGVVVNQRMFLYSVWGISLIFNMIDMCISILLIQGHRNQNESTCRIWFVIRFSLVVVSTVLVIAVLSTGESFLSQLPMIVYIIYRIAGLITVYKFIKYLRSQKTVIESETDIM